MKIKHVVTASLAAALVAVPTLGVAISSTQEKSEIMPSQVRTTANAEIQTKDEIVYANLSALGNVDAVYVVNHFEIGKEGSIVDYGDYDKVINLTNTDEIDQNGDMVSFHADEENYYYQGNLKSKTLPWDFELNYKLDGKSITPQELAGKNGKLEISVKSKQNESVDPLFYEHYMLQISLSLNTDKCSEIEAEDATVASAGNDKVLAFTVLPGGDADYTITADVTDFTMSGAEITAIPYSMDMDIDIEDSLGELDQLPGAISQLNNGVADLKVGTTQLKSGASYLSGGSSDIKFGLHQLSGNSGRLTGSSTEIDGALSQISWALNNGGGIDLSDLEQLRDGLQQLSGGLNGTADGLDTVNGSLAGAHFDLDALIATIPDAQVADADITTMRGQVSNTTAFDTLVDYYDAGNNVKTQYAGISGTLSYLETTSIPTMSGELRGMAGQLDLIADQIDDFMETGEGLVELTNGITALSNNYSQFHGGLNEYAAGVGQASNGYNEFDAGLKAYSKGVGELDDGVGQLYEGTSTLNAELSNLPGMIGEEIDKLKDEFMHGDFDPISFSSDKNGDTGFVQFIMLCEGVQKPEEEKTDTEEEKEEGFWDRLVGLFH